MNWIGIPNSWNPFLTLWVSLKLETDVKKCVQMNTYSTERGHENIHNLTKYSDKKGWNVQAKKKLGQWKTRKMSYFKETHSTWVYVAKILD